MAANFDPNDSDDGINDINITPFVDVVLVLLVIFMVTAPMIAKESLKIKLPKAESSDAPEPARVGISINKNGQVLLNGELVSLDSLKAEMQLAVSTQPEIQALISADTLTAHGDVIKVMDAVKASGIRNFAFQIERILNK